jgi:hypothetical protein
VALIPILARLLGYNLKTELAIVAIISFFPSFVFTAAGLRALPAGSTDLFQANGASTWHRLAFLVRTVMRSRYTPELARSPADDAMYMTKNVLSAASAAGVASRLANAMSSGASAI